MNLVREQRKLWNMRVTIIVIVIGTIGMLPKGLERGVEELEIGDNRNYGIVEISQNTEKSPRDLWRFVVIQAPVKNHQLTLV